MWGRGALKSKPRPNYKTVGLVLAISILGEVPCFWLRSPMSAGGVERSVGPGIKQEMAALGEVGVKPREQPARPVGSHSAIRTTSAQYSPSCIRTSSLFVARKLIALKDTHTLAKRNVSNEAHRP